MEFLATLPPIFYRTLTYEYTYVHTLVRIMRASTHGPIVLHVYIKVNCTNCLCAICDMSSDCCLPFLLCLVFLSFRCVSRALIHNSMLQIVCVLINLVLCCLCLPGLHFMYHPVELVLLVNVLAFYTVLIARLLRERLLRSFFISFFFNYRFLSVSYIYDIRTRDNNSTGVHVTFCSIERSASTANRHRTIQDEGPPKDRPSLSLVYVCYHLSKMYPTATPCVCLYPISDEIETHRKRIRSNHNQILSLYLSRLTVYPNSRSTTNASF